MSGSRGADQAATDDGQKEDVVNVALPVAQVISLCSGVDGIGLGLGIAGRIMGFRAVTVCHVERELAAAEILVGQMREGSLDDADVWSDVVTFPRVAWRWRGECDILTAGFPCTPFSMAGKRLGIHDPRHLWPYVARCVATLRPRVVFLENVPGLLTTVTPWRGATAYEVVQADLQSLAYTVAPGIYTAAEVGASHLRQRLFILAHRGGPSIVEDVGDSPGPRRGQGRPGESGEVRHEARRAEPERRCVDVGDAESNHQRRRRERGQAPQEQARGSSGGDVANTHGCGSREDIQPPELRPDWIKQSPGDSRCCTETESVEGPQGEGQVGLFPPGPDSPDWPAIVERWPWLAPALGNAAGKGSSTRKRSGRIEEGRPESADNGEGSAARDGQATEPGLRGVADGLPAMVDAAGRRRANRLRALGNAVVPACAAVAFLDLAYKLGLWEGP